MRLLRADEKGRVELEIERALVQEPHLSEARVEGGAAIGRRLAEGNVSPGSTENVEPFPPRSRDRDDEGGLRIERVGSVITPLKDVARQSGAEAEGKVLVDRHGGAKANARPDVVVDGRAHHLQADPESGLLLGVHEVSATQKQTEGECGGEGAHGGAELWNQVVRRIRSIVPIAKTPKSVVKDDTSTGT